MTTAKEDYFANIDGISANSKKLYNTKLHQWIEYLPESTQDITSLITLPQLSMERLEMKLKTPSNTNKHLYISSVITFLNKSPLIPLLLKKKKVDSLRDAWITIRNENSKPIVERRMNNQPTERQEAKGGSNLSWNDIIKKRDELPVGSMERLLMGMYSYLPPVRADYGKVRILKQGETSDEPNTITLGKKKATIILKDFKTAKKYGSITNDITGLLYKDLMQSLKDSPREWLFVDKKGQPFSRNGFSVWSKRILSKAFGAEFTVVMFRHLYLSNLDYNTLTTQQLVDIGKKMGQSLSMQSQYRWVKPEKKIEVTSTSQA